MAMSIEKEKSSLLVEPDSPPGNRIILLLVIFSLLLTGVCILLVQLFKVEAYEQVYQKNLSVENALLSEQRAKDHARLTTYDQLDIASGMYQIPVEQAMQELLMHPEYMAGIKK